jgi:anti-anti-sigma factor
MDMARLIRGNIAATREEGAGSYRYTAATGVWEWSGAVYGIHGFRRGEVVPSAELMLAHVHTGDRQETERLTRACLRDGKLFSHLYRLIDAAAGQHWVLIAGEGIFDAAGPMTGIRGYLIDLTAPLARARTREVTRMLRKAADSRAAIEQAKGALMLLYGLDAQTAFALLSWHSQHANVKLRELARRVVTGMSGDPGATAGMRARLDDNVYGPPGAPAPAPAPRPALSGAAKLLTAQRETFADGIVLHLSGEIDLATGPRMDGYLAEAVAAAAPPAPVIVDVSRVRHLGSIGVTLLTTYHRRCLAAGTPLRVVTGDGPAAGILAAAGPALSVYRRAPEPRKIRDSAS